MSMQKAAGVLYEALQARRCRIQGWTTKVCRRSRGPWRSQHKLIFTAQMTTVTLWMLHVAGKINTLKRDQVLPAALNVFELLRSFCSIYVKSLKISLVNPFYWLKGRVEGQAKYTECSQVPPTKALISLQHSNLKEEKLFKAWTMTWQLLTLQLSHNALLPDHRHSISFNIKSTQTISQHIWSRAEWKGNDYNLLCWLNSLTFLQ